MSEASGTRGSPLASLAESRSSLAEFFSDLAGSLGACSQAKNHATFLPISCLAGITDFHYIPLISKLMGWDIM